MKYIIEEMNKVNAIEYAKINALSWFESYGGIVNQEFLNKINTNVEIEKVAAKLAEGIEDESKRFLLQVDNKYVGLFRVRKTKYDGYSSYGELGALYLLNEFKSRGLGKIMFEYAKNELKKMGYTNMIVGCLEDNPSDNFYIHMGGKYEKKNPIIIGEQELNENLYLFNNI